MTKRNSIKRVERKNEGAADSNRWHFYVLTFMACTVLVSGFFFAGRQHFSSMDYGMKNSQLRRQLDELQAEKRRLLLAREISQSPGEIKKAAKKAGITGETQAVEIAGNLPPAKETKTDMKADIKVVSTKIDPPLVIRTAMMTSSAKPDRAAVKAPSRESAAE